MLATAVVLGVLAVALAWPVPVALAAARWPRRSPAPALVLWQAIALSGGLSMIGALLVAGLAPYGDDLATAGRVFVADVVAERPPPAEWGSLLAVFAALLLGGHLLVNLLSTVVSVQRSRRRHRVLVALLSTPMPQRPGARVIDDALPVAYCLPGADQPLTVFSAGLLERLGEEEVAAVVEHERTHLQQRHALLLTAFDAWRVSLPWFPIAALAHREVGQLVEMLADDRARRVHGGRTVASAIALVAVGAAEIALHRAGTTVASSPGPQASVGAPELSVRVGRLLAPVAPLPIVGVVAVAAASLALLLLPTVLVLFPVVSAAFAAPG